ncbi:MAG: A/G-specific adenine glycosylase [Rhizobiales bacterium 24-66-13]|jgi:A/G-specific adenine glycosylase|nr:MAG: A/G-specific adenine glycosylase [Rhizobiales bacterium 35-66-30]OYZ79825.1 MAG: A/G-specific adenine glycosylase [Rhizobiales bacterium 24-66-13]
MDDATLSAPRPRKKTAAPAAPAKVIPAKVKPAQVTPAQVKPAQVKPVKVKPVKVAGANTTGAKATRAKSAPPQGAGVKSAPARGRRAKNALLEVAGAAATGAEVTRGDVVGGAAGIAGESAAPAVPSGAIAAALLAWYDRHRRRLPWRAEGGRLGDPYHVFLSEIMLQQTTVKAVGPYFTAFLARWPRVADLAAAPLEEVLSAWAGLGYYARARNLHACAKAVVARHGGEFPADEAALLDLPGIGPYTAAAIAAIAFDLPASPVDGNIERVVSRLYAVDAPLPKSKPRIKALAAALTPHARPGDFAQGMMDLGATLCTPRSPACVLCPLCAPCLGRAAGDAARYPVKTAKGEKPARAGIAFLAVRADGAVLLRTRPEKGLLAQMTEVPSTPWSAGVPAPGDHAPLSAGAKGWRALPGRVSHVFTHFALELEVWRADLPAATPAPAGHRWVLPRDFAGEALPSVMRKVLAHGRVPGA